MEISLSEAKENVSKCRVLVAERRSIKNKKIIIDCLSSFASLK